MFSYSGFIGLLFVVYIVSGIKNIIEALDNRQY